MKFETTPEQQAKLQKIREYIAAQPDGEELSWLRIEHETGVPMDHKGRNMVRNILRSVRGRGGYASTRGEGVVLSAASTVVGIINNQGRRVRNAIKNWGDAVENAKNRHLEEMSPEDKHAILGRVAFLGALKTLAQGCVPKQLRARQKPPAEPGVG